MKNVSKRLFCLMLVLAMVVGVLPVMAMAAEEPVQATIADSFLVGIWADTREGSSVSASKSYDSSTTTMWNPEVVQSYVGTPGIVYVLDQTYDITELTLIHKHRHYYYDVAVSANGTDYTDVATVNATTAPGYYSSDNTCTLTVDAKSVNYIKLTFTGNAQAGNVYVALYDISVMGNVSAEQVPTAAVEQPETVKATITAGTPVGTWLADRVGSASVSPEKSFDDSMSSMWNPQAASASYNAGEGIVYKLDKAYDITKLSLTFKRQHYFRVLVSEDGIDYTLLKTINTSNVASYYTDVDTASEVVCCNLNVNVTNIQYVKLMFTGEKNMVGFVALYDISAYGSVSAQQVQQEIVTATITDSILVGTWADTKVGTSIAATASYDSSTSTMWNPEAAKAYSGDPGIVYVLDKTYDITELTLIHKHRHYYYNVAVSEDGINYTSIANVNATTAPVYYSSDNTCTLTVDAKQVNYIKLSFTGNAQSGNVFVALYDISVKGSVSAQQIQTTPSAQPEAIEATITAGTPVGTWVADRVGSASVPPENSFDDSMSSMWNPQANSTSYNSGEGIVYTLDKAYDITKLSLTLKRQHYFEVLISEDGTNYTSLKTVIAGNAASHYTVVDAATEVVRCDLNVNATKIKYVKIMFAGNAVNNAFVALYDISIMGNVHTNTSGYAVIASGTPVGTWANDRVGLSSSPENSYDDSMISLWNPQSASIDFADGEGIVYTLDDSYDISEISLTFMRNHYFTLQVSGNGEAYKTLAIVNASNAETAYTVIDDTVVGKPVVRYDLDEEFEGIKYVKLLFSGHAGNTAFVSLYDIRIKGVISNTQEDVCEEHFYGDWIVEKAATYTEAGSRSKSCIYCGNTVTEEIPVLANPVTGYNIILRDKISVNFRMELAETDVIAITVGGETASYDRNDSAISVDVAAAQMTDSIVISINGIALPNTYSVRGYADYILDEENGFDDVTKNLVNAMLVYGGAAQEYFEYNTGSLASAGIEMSTVAPTGDSAAAVADNLDGINFYGATLVHKNKIAVRFYFSGSIDGLTTDQGDFVQKGDMYYIEVADINPQNIGDTIEVEVTDGTDSLTVSYSPLTYIVRMYEKADSSAATKALVKALYNYYLAALAYTN